MANTIQHSEHKHLLTEANAIVAFTCGGCKLNGDVGKTYRCNDCDYDLHEYCAKCPQTLANSWHDPSHELTLISGTTDRVAEVGCYVCRAYIQGMFYKCKQCTFESHPLCANGPIQDVNTDSTETEHEQDSSNGKKKMRKRDALLAAATVTGVGVLIAAKFSIKISIKIAREIAVAAFTDEL